MNEIHNIKYKGFCAVKHKGVICSKSIKEAIRSIDAMETELQYAKRKFRYHWDVIDMKARNAFSMKLVMPSIIKCASR